MITDKVVRDWIGRHDFGSMSLTDARAAIGDAASLEAVADNDETVRDAVAKRDALQARIDGAATGIVQEVGDDETGQPRVLIYSTRDELMRGPAIACKRVALVVVE